MTQIEKTIARVVNRELNNHRVNNVEFSVFEWSSQRNIDIKFFSLTGKASRITQNLIPHIQKRLKKTKKAANIKKDIVFSHEYVLFD